MSPPNSRIWATAKGVWALFQEKFKEQRAMRLSQENDSRSTQGGGDAKSLFNEASRLVKVIEAQLIGETVLPSPELHDMKRLLWLPIPFLCMGIWGEVKSFLDLRVLLSVVCFFSIVIALSISIPGIASTKALNSDLVYAFALIYGWVVLIFPIPSMFGDSSVSQKNVNAVVTHLRTQSFKTAKEIELLKKSVKQFEDRMRSRVTALKWIVGLIWVSFVSTVPKDVFYSQVTKFQIDSSVNWLLLVIPAYFLVWGYEASVDKLFRTIEFGCNDFCYQKEIEGLP